MDSNTLALLTIPLFSGAIGYLTNWTGVWMLFHPVHFAGVRFPGLRPLAGLLPRRVQQIPGVMQGGVGWQGILPSRAAKMGSIAVDKGIAKLGSPADFYAQLEPDAIAEHILASARGDIRRVVERIMEREHPRLWRDVPPRVREAVHERVQQQLPDIVHAVTGEIGEIIAEDVVTLSNIGEELLDGPRSDRTRQMIETAMRPAVDRAVGVAQPAIRVAVGTREYDAIRTSVAVDAVDYTMTPLADPEFNRRQSSAVRTLIADRMRELPSKDFSEMLRSAMREDEWLLLLHGAVLGFGAGLLHLLIFG